MSSKSGRILLVPDSRLLLGSRTVKSVHVESTQMLTGAIEPSWSSGLKADVRFKPGRFYDLRGDVRELLGQPTQVLRTNVECTCLKPVLIPGKIELRPPDDPGRL